MAYLPVTVVAELELNSVKPPPDTFEEDSKNTNYQLMLVIRT